MFTLSPRFVVVSKLSFTIFMKPYVLKHENNRNAWETYIWVDPARVVTCGSRPGLSECFCSHESIQMYDLVSDCRRTVCVKERGTYGFS